MTSLKQIITFVTILISFFISVRANATIEDLKAIEWDVVCKNAVEVTVAGKLTTILSNPLNNSILKAVDSGNGFYVLCFKDSDEPLKVTSEVSVVNNLDKTLVLHNFELAKSSNFTGSNLLSITSFETSPAPMSVIIYDGNIDGKISIAGDGHAVIGGTVSGITVTSSASDVVISNVDIASSGGTGIDVAGQQVTITGPNFIGDIATPILLAEGANAGVKPPDIAKVFRKMSEDEKLVEGIVGVVENDGNVELFRRYGEEGNKKTIYLKNCPIDKKENTSYSASDAIPANSLIFICSDLSEPVKRYISFTFSDKDGNTSTMSETILLEDKDIIFSVPSPPPFDLPTTQDRETVPEDEVDNPVATTQRIGVDEGSGDGGQKIEGVGSCRGTISATADGSAAQAIILLIPFAFLVCTRLTRRRR